jgi:hypothetical protein
MPEEKSIIRNGTGKQKEEIQWREKSHVTEKVSKPF